MKYYIIVIFAVMVSACSQILLKQGTKKNYQTIWQQYLNLWVISGYIIMGVAMLANIFAMSKGVQVKEVSTIESFSYLFVPFLSWMLFNERITKKKAISITLIIIGIIIFFQ